MATITRWAEERPATDDERLELLADLDESGLSVEEFARSAQLSPGTIRSWRRRLTRDFREAQSPDFVELRVRDDDSAASHTELVGEIVIAGGVTVCVRAGFDEHEL